MLVTLSGGPFCGSYESLMPLPDGKYPDDIVLQSPSGERALYAIDVKHRRAIYWGTSEDFQRPMTNVRQQEPSSQDPQAGQSEPQG